MRRNEPITTIMTANPLVVQLGEPASRVRKLLADQSIHHIPVLDGKRLVGMIGATDLASRIWGASDGRGADTLLDHTVTIGELMTANPVAIDVHGTVRQAAEAMVSGRFHAVPVTKNGELVGIATTTDILSYLLEQY